jgi:hypothetical protein
MTITEPTPARRLPGPRPLRQPGAVGDAQGLRRPRGKARRMSVVPEARR